MTIRAVLLGLINDGVTRILHPGDCEDSRIALDAAKSLGKTIETSAEEWRLSGQLQESSAPISIDVGNSGLTCRLLTAILATLPGQFILIGKDAMYLRPIKNLVDALRSIGADIAYNQQEGYPPLTINGKHIQGGSLQLDSSQSGQFVSALIMAAMQMETGLQMESQAVSLPYVDMTITMLQNATAELSRSEYHYSISPKTWDQEIEIVVEADLSAAANYFALAALLRRTIHVHGVSETSLQGDLEMLSFMDAMGCTHKFHDEGVTITGASLTSMNADLKDCPDLAPVLACLCSQADGVSRLTGLAHLRYKETDRLAAIQTELKRCGIQVDIENGETLIIHPGDLQGADIECYDDHRIAMSFSILNLIQPDIRIKDPGCVAKSYPRFFEDLQAVLDR